MRSLFVVRMRVRCEVVYVVTVIPEAIATGRCELRADSTVFRVETNARGRTTGVAYWDKDGRERRQHARAVVLAANSAETTRLLLLSTSPAFPQGLANSSGNVGRHIMFNGHSWTFGRFEHPLNEYKGVVATRVIHDFYQTDPKRGNYGGGGIDSRFNFGPIGFAIEGFPPDLPSWGSEYKRALREYYTHSVPDGAHHVAPRRDQHGHSTPSIGIVGTAGLSNVSRSPG